MHVMAIPEEILPYLCKNKLGIVGLFNLIPLLPLDGGHIAVAVYERIRSRKGIRYHADASKLLPLTYAVVFALIFIGIAAVYLDIADPISL